MADNCIHCQHPVRAKQQGIQCDGCLKWNHRTCNTGISQQQYRAAVRAGAEILWFCAPSRSSSRKLTSVRGVRYFWPVELHFGVGGVQSSTRVVRPVHDLRSTSPGRSYTFFFQPIWQEFDLAYSLLFSGSFKPGIFFGDVVSIYYKLSDRN